MRTAAEAKPVYVRPKIRARRLGVDTHSEAIVFSIAKVTSAARRGWPDTIGCFFGLEGVMSSRRFFRFPTS